MPNIARGRSDDNDRIVLGLLQSVERESRQSQRRLAANLGIAVGLVNAYLKRCINKGLVKMSKAPARRYAYYLTPRGFAEKSRLTLEYLSSSFTFFRKARSECSQILEVLKVGGIDRVVLAGRSELAEIATICALETGVTIVAICDPAAAPSLFLGVPVVQSYDDVPGPFDAVMVTDLVNPAEACQAAAARCRAGRVLVPNLLGIHVRAVARQ